MLLRLTSLALLLTLAVACDRQLAKLDMATVKIGKPVPGMFGTFTVTGRQPLAAKVGETVTLTGTNFSGGFTLKDHDSGKTIPVAVVSDTSATFELPDWGKPRGLSLFATQGSTTAQIDLVFLGKKGDIPVMTVAPSEVCSGQSFYDADGALQTGTRACYESVPSDCTSDGQTGCVTTASFVAADASTAIATNIKLGATIAGVSGSVVEGALVACTADGASGCVVDGTTYKAALMANVTAPAIAAGTSIAGVSGSAILESHSNCSAEGSAGCVTTATYSSALVTGLSSKVLSGQSVAGISGNVVLPAASKVLAGTSFGISGGTAGSATLPDPAKVLAGEAAYGDASALLTPSLANRGTWNLTATFPGAGYYAGVSNTPLATVIKSGTTITGVSGSVTAESHVDCAADGTTGCVTTAGFPAANVTGLAPKVLSGQTVAAVAGTATLPSAGKVLAGTSYGAPGALMTGTLNLPSASNVLAGSGAYGETGAELTPALTNQGTWNLASAFPGAGYYSGVSGTPAGSSIVSGSTILGVAGTTTAETHSTCAADGASGCVVDGTSYKAAKLSNFNSGDIRDTIQIAGVTGTLTGAPSSCAVDGAIGCVANSSFVAVDIAKLLSHNLRNGVVIASVTGTYPSAGDPLLNGTATPDLTSFSNATPLGSYEFFDSAGNVYAANVLTQSSVTPTTTAQTISSASGLYKAVDVDGDADLLASNIMTGIGVFGVTGTVTQPAVGKVLTGTSYGAGGNALAGTLTLPLANNVLATSGTYGDPGSAITPTLANQGSWNLLTAFPGAGYYSGVTGTPASSSIVSGSTILGVSGTTAAESHSDCAVDGGTGCVANASYLAVDEAKLVAGNIKSGVVIASVTGSYPSVSTPLASGTGTTDLTSFSNATPLGTYEFFDSAGNAYAANVLSQSSVTPTASAQTISSVSGLYKAVDIAGDADLTVANLRTGVSLFGVTGSLIEETHTSCATAGAQDCVASGTYYAAPTCAANDSNCYLPTYVYASQPFKAISYDSIDSSKMLDTLTIAGQTGTIVTRGSWDMTAVSFPGAGYYSGVTTPSAGWIKSGSTIAGVVGQYPSNTYRLDGYAGGTDLPLFTATTGGSAYVWFTSDGVMRSGSIQADQTVTPDWAGQTLAAGLYRSVTVNGDMDLSAANIRSGTVLFNITGTLVETPANCVSNGQQNCVAQGSYYAGTSCVDNGSACYLPTYVASTQPRKAIDYDAIVSAAGSLRSAVSLAGVTGILLDCNANQQMSCVTGLTYKAADLSMLSAGNVKDGVTIAGQIGNYPSSTYPLSTSTATTDLTAFNNTLAAQTYEFFDSAGARYTGTVMNQSPVTPTTTAQSISSVSGLYREVVVDGDTNLTPANIKNAATIFGVTGQYPSATYAISSADSTTDLPAFALVTGGTTYEWFKSDGTRMTGTVNADVTAVPGTSNQVFNSGVYHSVTVQGDANLLASKIREGTSIFGVTGTLGFPDFVASGIHRDTNAPAWSLRDELNFLGSADTMATATYKRYEVPRVSLDNIGYTTSVSVVLRQTGGAQWGVGQTRKTCGRAATSVVAKIADCEAYNGAITPWDGATKGNMGEGSWTLVTVTSESLTTDGTTCNTTCREVWRDDRTGLLWSDVLRHGGDTILAYSWCTAAGVTTASDPTSCPTDNVAQFNPPESTCAEVTGLTTHAVFDDEKGMMRASTTPSVRWRLPSASDWGIANFNGARRVLAITDANNSHFGWVWTSTVGAGSELAQAILYVPSQGSLVMSGPSYTRNKESAIVLCVGRPGS